MDLLSLRKSLEMAPQGTFHDFPLFSVVQSILQFMVAINTSKTCKKNTDNIKLHFKKSLKCDEVINSVTSGQYSITPTSACDKGYSLNPLTSSAAPVLHAILCYIMLGFRYI